MHYRQCKYQGVVYTVGDDVMISNSEADDPESVMDCYVASIIHMYEMSMWTFIFHSVVCSCIDL